jgi:hypothetical protein
MQKAASAQALHLTLLGASEPCQGHPIVLVPSRMLTGPGNSLAKVTSTIGPATAMLRSSAWSGAAPKITCTRSTKEALCEAAPRQHPGCTALHVVKSML